MTVLRPLLMFCLLCACADEPPLLTGIPQTPLLQDTPQETQGTEKKDKAKAQAYTKARNIFVDVRYLGGKPYAQVRDLLSEQMGGLKSRAPAARQGGQLLTFEHGQARIINNTVAMIKVRLPEPVRRTQALEILGFPPYVGGYTIFHREYRLHHEWGFRRIRLMREDRRSERVIEVEVWRWLPSERELGR